MQMDYRNVFTALLQDWLGASDAIIRDTLFEDYLATKAPVLEAAMIVQPDCYIDNYLSTPFIDRSRTLNVYPNPASQFIRFQLEADYQAMGTVRIFDMQGRVCSEHLINNHNGQNTIEIPVVNLWPGSYTVQISFAHQRGRFVSRFVKI